MWISSTHSLFLGGVDKWTLSKRIWRHRCHGQTCRTSDKTKRESGKSHVCSWVGRQRLEMHNKDIQRPCLRMSPGRPTTQPTNPTNPLTNVTKARRNGPERARPGALCAWGRSSGRKVLATTSDEFLCGVVLVLERSG